MVKVPKWFSFDLKTQRANIHYNKRLIFHYIKIGRKKMEMRLKLERKIGLDLKVLCFKKFQMFLT